jgi:hypothetical protein
MPAHGIQWIERVGHRGDHAAPLDLYAPLLFILLRQEGVVDARRVQHGRIEDGMRPHQPLVRQPVGVVGRLDEQRRHRLGARKPPHGAARNEDVVAGFERQPAVVAEQLAATGMYEQ